MKEDLEFLDLIKRELYEKNEAKTLERQILKWTNSSEGFYELIKDVIGAKEDSNE